MSASILDSSPQKIYGFKLRRLIVDGGTQALRNVFNKIHSGPLQAVLFSNQHVLLPLKGKIVKPPQWDKLYPAPPKLPNINEFDITLLVILLRNICRLTASATGWDHLPAASDTSPEGDIARIKWYRNDLYGHIPETGVSKTDFNSYWNEISPALVRLGIDQQEIDQLKVEECGKEVVERVTNEWNAMEVDIKFDLERVNSNLKATQQMVADSFQYTQIDQKVNKKLLMENQGKVEETLKVSNETQNVVCESRDRLEMMQSAIKDIEEQTRLRAEKLKRSDEMLKKLVRCDFTPERKILCKAFVNGTREWVFAQVFAWFNDNSSEHRAFIITGNAGMGKSVIAAVICQKISEQLAGCHFCRYNDSRYSDPKVLLQSLAFQVANILPKFKDALVDQLSRNLGRGLNEMNIEGLFSILFKETLCRIENPGKSFLIVIDGVDESDDYNVRHEFVDLIATHLHKLPKFIRFLITTRPEHFITEKFEDFDPLYLHQDDENNKKDVKIFLEKNIQSVGEIARNRYLVRKFTCLADGLMLYAFFLVEIFKENRVQDNVDTFPEGLNSVFEMYFKRLENDLCSTLEINEDIFLSLLSAIAVATEPLPLNFISHILGEQTGKPSGIRKIRKAINCISSLFVIDDDRIRFFHKSVKDWLVRKEDHDYKINEQLGHAVLAKCCAQSIDKIKRSGCSSSIFNVADNRYALKFGIHHMLMDVDKFLFYVASYVVDVEVLYLACLGGEMSGVLSEIVEIGNHKDYNNLADETKTKLDELIQLFTFQILFDSF